MAGNLRDMAQEVLNVWLEEDNDPTFSVNPTFSDPAIWGLLFVDITRTLAHAYAENGADADHTANRIKAAFIAEFESPTS